MTIEIKFRGGPHAFRTLPMPNDPPLNIQIGETFPIDDPALYAFADGVENLSLVSAHHEKTHHYLLSYRDSGWTYDYMGKGDGPGGRLDMTGEGNP